MILAACCSNVPSQLQLFTTQLLTFCHSEAALHPALKHILPMVTGSVVVSGPAQECPYAELHGRKLCQT